MRLLGLLAGVGVTLTLMRTAAGTAVAPRNGGLRPERAGLSAGAVELPERAFYMQNSRGWQFRSLPATIRGDAGVLAASDGVYWNFELRALVKKEAAAAARI